MGVKIDIFFLGIDRRKDNKEMFMYLMFDYIFLWNDGLGNEL